TISDEGLGMRFFLSNVALIPTFYPVFSLPPPFYTFTYWLKSSVYNAAKKEPVLELVVDFLTNNPTASGTDVGAFVAKEYEREWTEASLQRIGNSLKQWGRWLLLGKDSEAIPRPLGQRDKHDNKGQLSLWQDDK
ncbi:MAG: hypothetical protein WAU10_10020, partial [Caldilineaceae bacterium]